MTDYDVIIIGAGHNGLVCGGYLAKAGYKVCMVEARHKVGGAVVTEEHIPGYKFDLGGSAHILINHTPIVADLELEKYGLEYIDLDPLFFAPFPDDSHIMMWRDVDRTCESIAQFSPEDADNYRNFVKEWQPISAGMVEAFLHTPTPLNMAKYLAYKTFDSKDEHYLSKATMLLRNYGHVLEKSFVDPRTRGFIGWMAAQSGPPPTEPMSGPFALWHPMYHISGMRRPKGGSGMLTQALASMIEAHGGTIITSSPVQKILTENDHATGVELPDGSIITAKKIASGAHVHTTMKMLGDAAPAKARRLIDNTRIGNGFGMIVRCAVDELPNYSATPNPIGPEHTAMQFICPDLNYLNRAYGDYLGGQPSRDPALIGMTWSHADPSLAPEGKHVLFIWGQYYPYELADGRDWDEIGEVVAERMFDKLSEYAPNVKGSVTGKLVETPLYLERELGLLRGNVMHLEMSIDQMFAFRPALSMSNYRGPVKDLYLTGASTHPGGGIMGAAGMNAAGVILKDLSSRKWFKGR